MSVDNVGSIQTHALKPQQMPVKEPSLIKLEDIKAILYLGLRGDISLPVENRKVDILA